MATPKRLDQLGQAVRDWPLRNAQNPFARRNPDLDGLDRAQAREAQLEERFARLNPEFGVLPSRIDPQQQRFAQGRERALAMGTRVHLAEARENSGSPELAAWMIRERALRATRLAQAERLVQTRTTEPARAGAER